jgi:excisionase family DNA binding protein
MHTPDIDTYGLPATLSVDRVAAFLNLDRKTVYDSIARGEIPARRIGRRRIVILRCALLDWVGQGRVIASHGEKQ